jgi:hypothetical protein
MEPGQQESKLYVQTLTANANLRAALAGEGSWTGHMLGLEAQLKDGWSIVSHSFEYHGQDDEGRELFLFSCILVK